MTLTRRLFLQATSAAAILPAMPRFARADIAAANGTVTVVNDGHLTLPGSFVFDGMPQDELANILSEYGIDPGGVTPPCNVTLYRDDERTVLFDVGSGNDFMPTAGDLIDNLAAADVTPDDITDVVFTHAHPDHLWGLLDDFDEPAFANARYLIGKDEWDYWTDPDTVDTIGEARASFAVGAKRRLDTLEDRFEFFQDGEEVLPGIAAVATYGHTPGHMSFEVGSEVFVIGDAIGNHHVAFAKPQWEANSDQNPEKGAATRTALIDRLASQQPAIIGFHLPGGLGRVEKAAEGYRFVGADQ